MRRRDFNWVLAAGALGLPLVRQTDTALVSVDGDRLNRRLAKLATFGRDADGGTSRLAFSPADRNARAWLQGVMAQAGLAPRIDAAGSLIGVRVGSDPERPILMMGSHIDTVPSGGNYDGCVGALAAVEVAQRLHELGRSLRHSLEVVIFSNEEDGKTGSRAMSGELREEDLSHRTASGLTVRDGVKAIGGDPGSLSTARLASGRIAAFLELHIEQGGVLEREGVTIGVVEGIVGIKRWNVTVSGFANHAGTTPMAARRDALLAAARFIDAVNRVAVERDGSQVATVGRIVAEPGAPNVIPGKVVASLEIRDLTMSVIDEVFSGVEREAARIARETGTRFEFEQFYLTRGAPTDERIRQRIEAAADAHGFSRMRMPSGAGHDAQSLALLAPMGMIFVPSVDGISHSPRELSTPADITAGADVLLGTLLGLDRASQL